MVPSSCTMGALSHLSMYNSAHLHVMCFRTARSKSRGRCCRRTPRHTPHLKDLPEQVRITRPQHPFEGKALAVFGRRRYQSKPHLILILPDGSRALIPTEWTDLDSSTPGSP